MNIKRKLNKNRFYKWVVTTFHKIIVKVNPAWEMKRCYKILYGKSPDLKTPKELVEKIYWLQLHSDTSLWTKCADKYAVREYIGECGFSDFLPKLYGKWNTVEEVDFEALPTSFVLKTNNSCGTVLIVKDKSRLDMDKAAKDLKRWMKDTYGYRGAQLHYLRIKPCIIAEEFLVADEEQSRISPKSLIDYKVYCFHGKPECIWVAFNRTKDGVWMNLFDTEWNEMGNKVIDGFEDYYFYHPEVKFDKPSCLQKILEMASILSKPFAEVRVDFYIIGDKPVVGELTFTSGTGFFTEDYYKYLGSRIDLTKVKKIK